MNNKQWLLAIAIVIVLILHTHYVFGQSTYFTGPLGEPRGQAWTSGNQTNVTSETGVPMGSARSQYGAPPPVAITVTPIQPVQPITPIQPLPPKR